MRVALLVVLVCAAVDLAACAVLLAFVWVEYRRVRREAASLGNPIPSAAGQFGCIVAFGVVGFVVLYGAAWLLLSE